MKRRANADHGARFRRATLALVLGLALAGCDNTLPADREETARESPRASAPAAPDTPNAGDAAIARAYAARESDVQVEGEGTVVKILRDDTDGSRHQRFILRLASKQTLLVAHNLDLSRRIESLRVGDRVAFRGEYEWNAAGGVLHWTHDDPAGRHPGGWIKHGGTTYH